MKAKELGSFVSDASQVLRKDHMIGGTRAVNSNNLLVTQFYTAWLYLASDVLSQSCVDDKSFCQRILNFRDTLRDFDVTDILTFCQGTADLLIRDQYSSYGDFKGHLTTQYPLPERLITGLLSPISPLLVSLFECPDVKAVSLRLVLQFLRFGKKLNLQAIGLEDKALTDYINNEERVGSVVIDPNSDLVKGLNRILRTWLADLDFKNLVPQHGSGSVAEGKLTLYEKYNRLGADVYLRCVLQATLPEYFPCGLGTASARVSRTVFVPKTFAKLRTISMEPVTLQYFQQGVMKILYRYIKCHPYLGRRVKLDEQEQNQLMAKQGSIDNSLSTIDLSAASDSVSWSLVKAVFHRTPLLKWIYATRSSKTLLPNGEVIALKKCAPMGSALCFPIECLIFAAVIEYVAQRWCYSECQAKPDYSVYGDDLVVPKAITNDLIEALTSLGFVVNTEKSFTDGSFRESCGKDYFEGIDVSSVYYRLSAVNTQRLSPDDFAAICSGCNNAYERDLKHLRSFYLSLILKKSPYFTNTTSKSPQVFSLQPTNFHVRRVWSDDYQEWLGRFCTAQSRPVRREFPDEDAIAYFMKLAQMSERKVRLISSDEPVSSTSLHGTSNRLGWMLRPID